MRPRANCGAACAIMALSAVISPPTSVASICMMRSSSRSSRPRSISTCRCSCIRPIPLGKDRTREYELTIVAGYLFDNTINILKMICSGFLDRWPTLKLVCAHAGAFSPVLRARMQREVDTNPQLRRTLKMPVGDYLRRLYFDTDLLRAGDPALCRPRCVPVEHLHAGQRRAVSARRARSGDFRARGACRRIRPSSF